MEKKKSTLDKYKLGRIDLSNVNEYFLYWCSKSACRYGGRTDIWYWVVSAGFLENVCFDFPLFMFRRMQSGSYAAKATEKPSLGRGIGIAMVGSSLTYGTHWTVYEYFKRHLSPLCQGKEAAIPFVYMLSASLGDFLLALLIFSSNNFFKHPMPLWGDKTTSSNRYFFRHKMRCSLHLPRFFSRLSSLLVRRNPRLLYRLQKSPVQEHSLWCNRGSLSPCAKLQMTLYEIFRKYYKKLFVAPLLGSDAQKSSNDTSLVMSVLSGYCSSGIAAFVTTPMDVVKTRMMLSASERDPETSVIQMFRKIYRVFVIGMIEL